MCSRSTSSSAEELPSAGSRPRKAAPSACPPGERITARSIRCSSSRILPGPGVVHQGLHCFRRHVFDILLHALGIFRQEILDQQRNILAPIAQRRNGDGEDVQAIVEIAAKLAALTIFFRSRLVAATMRASLVRVRELPRRSNSFSCSARSSFACISSGISPTSSRNSVPWLASSRRPMRWARWPR